MDDAISFLENLLNPSVWKRVGLVLFGGILMFYAVVHFQLSDRASAILRTM